MPSWMSTPNVILPDRPSSNSPIPSSHSSASEGSRSSEASEAIVGVALEEVGVAAIEDLSDVVGCGMFRISFVLQLVDIFPNLDAFLS